MAKNKKPNFKSCSTTALKFPLLLVRITSPKHRKTLKCCTGEVKKRNLLTLLVGCVINGEVTWELTMEVPHKNRA